MQSAFLISAVKLLLVLFCLLISFSLFFFFSFLFCYYLPFYFCLLLFIFFYILIIFYIEISSYLAPGSRVRQRRFQSGWKKRWRSIPIWFSGRQQPTIDMWIYLIGSLIIFLFLFLFELASIDSSNWIACELHFKQSVIDSCQWELIDLFFMVPSAPADNDWLEVKCFTSFTSSFPIDIQKRNG